VSTPLRLADTKNDQLVGQAGTPRAAAKLFTLLSQGRLQGVTVSEEMTALLRASVAHSTPWIMRVPDISVDGEAARGVSFDVWANKLGVAPLKAANGGHSVYSEASILRRGSRWFVVAWQNFLYGADGFRPIARLVDRAIEDFLRP
jgi:hypothetical protein